MRRIIRLFFQLSALIVFTAACVAQSVPNQVYGFAQTSNGHWKPMSQDKLQYYQVTSKVTCNSTYSEIEIVWNSESSDWAAYDQYSSKGNFLARLIRLAASDDTIKIIKQRPNSRPIMKINGDEAKEYEYLLNELNIWTKISDFPYRLPKCALKIFR